MATRILQVDSSVFGNGGVSSELSNFLVEQLTRQLGPVEVARRDLTAHPVPHLTLDTLGAVGAKPGEVTPEQAEARQLADRLIDEVFLAEILIVAAPMYNFGIPSVLKAWIDHIARAGTTFRYTSAGAEGLVRDKTLFIVATRGGVYPEGDTQVPFLQTFFRFLGFEDIRTVYAEGLNMSELRNDGLAKAKARIIHLAQQKHEEVA